VRAGLRLRPRARAVNAAAGHHAVCGGTFLLGQKGLP